MPKMSAQEIAKRLDQANLGWELKDAWLIRDALMPIIVNGSLNQCTTAAKWIISTGIDAVSGLVTAYFTERQRRGWSNKHSHISDWKEKSDDLC
jgi:hypothetical protein